MSLESVPSTVEQNRSRLNISDRIQKLLARLRETRQTRKVQSPGSDEQSTKGLDISRRKALGMFFTAPAVAEKIIRSATPDRPVQTTEGELTPEQLQNLKEGIIKGARPLIVAEGQDLLEAMIKSNVVFVDPTDDPYYRGLQEAGTPAKRWGSPRLRETGMNDLVEIGGGKQEYSALSSLVAINPDKDDGFMSPLSIQAIVYYKDVDMISRNEYNSEFAATQRVEMMIPFSGKALERLYQEQSEKPKGFYVEAALLTQAEIRALPNGKAYIDMLNQYYADLQQVPVDRRKNFFPIDDSDQEATDPQSSVVNSLEQVGSMIPVMIVGNRYVQEDMKVLLPELSGPEGNADGLSEKTNLVVRLQRSSVGVAPTGMGAW
jgi:hypothetical protein